VERAAPANSVRRGTAHHHHSASRPCEFRECCDHRVHSGRIPGERRDFGFSSTEFLYLPLQNNCLVFNPHDGLLYASVPGSAVGSLGNSIVAVDPITGNIMRQIAVGSQPNKIAISDDGTQLFVGLDGAGAVRQVNLSTGQPGQQFSLGGGPGVYNPPYTAAALAVLPGEPNSVAVFATNGIVTIYDSGVARPKTSAGLINTYFN
jgi:hypothetical protein